jgi:hypothetical protein
MYQPVVEFYTVVCSLENNTREAILTAVVDKVKPCPTVEDDMWSFQVITG